MTVRLDFDKLREMVAADYSDHGDDAGEPMIVGAVAITAVGHLTDGSTKTLFLRDGSLDECLGMLIRHSDILREEASDG